MSKEASKEARSQSALEDVGSSELAEFVRDEMHDRVEALREKLVSAMDASAKAASAEHRAMKVYLTSAQAWRRKAEELHTIADQTTSPKAKETFRFLARSYDLLADRVEASESRKSEKSAPKVG
jgi:hypothetical protein